MIPGLSGKDYSPRRIGYVYDNKWNVVAKIADDSNPLKVASKLIGNYDRIVDVYHPGLAKNDSFGALLCGFSRFLTHQKKYRDNRRQEIQPDGKILAQTGDNDLLGQL